MFDNLLCSGPDVNNQWARFRSEPNATRTIVRELEGLMSSATTDRRVRRTRELLRSALFSLIVERGYERITVQDILDKADVGRSTFYAHYRDKDDLLRSGFEDLRSALATETAGDGNAAHGKAEFLQPVLAVFQHVEAHRHLWKPLAGKGGAYLVIRILRENVSDLVREHFRSQLPGWKEDQTQLEAAVQFVVSALIGVITWWLDRRLSSWGTAPLIEQANDRSVEWSPKLPSRAGPRMARCEPCRVFGGQWSSVLARLLQTRRKRPGQHQMSPGRHPTARRGPLTWTGWHPAAPANRGQQDSSGNRTRPRTSKPGIACKRDGGFDSLRLRDRESRPAG